MEAAKIILSQLGGNRFIAMTGAKNFGILANGQGIGFTIPMRNGVRGVRIMLNGLDLYDMEFLNRKFEVAKRASGIYSDMLQSTFTQHTGLYTSL